MRKFNRAQSTLEYAIIIAAVVAALLAIQIYMKRGVQGKLRSSVDTIGEQYSAGQTTSKYTTEQIGDMQTTEEFGKEGTGVSKYTVDSAAEIKRKARGQDAERITQKLEEEEL